MCPGVKVTEGMWKLGCLKLEISKILFNNRVKTHHCWCVGRSLERRRSTSAAPSQSPCRNSSGEHKGARG